MPKILLFVAVVVAIGVILWIVAKRTAADRATSGAAPAAPPAVAAPTAPADLADPNSSTAGVPPGPAYSTTQQVFGGEAETKTDFERAIAKLKEHDATAAITIMRQAVTRTAAARGATSPEHASALYHLGAIYLGAGDLRSAATALENCCSIQPTDGQSTKDHLTYLMNLGDVYGQMGEFDKAAQVQRDGLARRAKFYGTDHAGYAYGLSALADMLLRQDRSAEALPLITQARDICLHSPSPLLADAYALRAFAVKATGGADAEAFAGVAELPPDVRREVYESIIRRARTAEHAGMVATLDALSRRLEASATTGAAATARDADVDDELRWNAGASLVHVARLSHDHAAWIAGDDRLIALARKSGNRAGLIEVLQNKAIALNEAKDPAGELAAYQSALAEATALKDPRILSVVHRNVGLYYRDQNKRAEAEEHLAASVEMARKANAPAEIGAALAAHGIFVQHNGDLARAKPMLQEAVTQMPTTHPHYLFAANHLSAIEKSASCGCGDMGETVSQTIKKMVRDRLPADLLDDVQISFDPGGKPDVKVNLKRTPTPAELENVQTVVNQAVIDLQRAVRER